MDHFHFSVLTIWTETATQPQAPPPRHVIEILGSRAHTEAEPPVLASGPPSAHERRAARYVGPARSGPAPKHPGTFVLVPCPCPCPCPWCAANDHHGCDAAATPFATSSTYVRASTAYKNSSRPGIVPHVPAFSCLLRCCCVQRAAMQICILTSHQSHHTTPPNPRARALVRKKKKK